MSDLDKVLDLEATCMEQATCRSGCDDHPQVCVEWCDAQAYCLAVGKRLCGKIGGGPNALADYDDPTRSAWLNACSNEGTKDYPYGDLYDPTLCGRDQPPGE